MAGAAANSGTILQRCAKSALLLRGTARVLATGWSAARAVGRDDDNARSPAGLPSVTLALQALSLSLAWLRIGSACANIAAIFGGSHAQRDLLDLTCRSGAAQRQGGWWPHWRRNGLRQRP